MKKLLLILCVITAGIAASAQCLPESDFSTGTLELSNSSIDPVYACSDCGDQVRVISVQTFGDTTLSVVLQPGQPALDVTVFADFFRLDSIGGLPDGIIYTTDASFDTTYDAVDNPFGYWVNPGDTAVGFENTIGCISLSGNASDWTNAIGGGPNNDGVYPLTIYIDARAANFDPAGISNVVGYNTWLTEMGSLLDAFGDPNFTVNGIKLTGQTLTVVESGVGIQESEAASSFGLVPNPAKETVSIQFSAQKPSRTVLKVIGVDGREVYNQSMQTTSSETRFELDLARFQAGVYFVVIENENGISVKKLIVE